MKDLYNIDDWTDVSGFRLGEILLESGKINLVHLSMALDIQKFRKMPLGEIFAAMKLISCDDLSQALYVQDIVRKKCDNAQ